MKTTYGSGKRGGSLNATRVLVLFDAMTGMYRQVYHNEGCHHLESGFKAVKSLPILDAEKRRISPCLHCHETKTRNWTCPECNEWFKLTIDRKNPGLTMMQCPNGHMNLKQRYRRKR